jgi:hypothetical protein
MSCQRMVVLAGREQRGGVGESILTTRVDRSQQDLMGAMRDDGATSEDVQRKIDCKCTWVKEIKRPDVKGAAGKIHTARSRGDDSGSRHIIL